MGTRFMATTGGARAREGQAGAGRRHPSSTRASSCGRSATPSACSKNAASRRCWRSSARKGDALKIEDIYRRGRRRLSERHDRGRHGGGRLELRHGRRADPRRARACKELIDRIMAEAESIIHRRLTGMIGVTGGRPRRGMALVFSVRKQSAAGEGRVKGSHAFQRLSRVPRAGDRRSPLQNERCAPDFSWARSLGCRGDLRSPASTLIGFGASPRCPSPCPLPWAQCAYGKRKATPCVPNQQYERNVGRPYPDNNPT